MERVFFHVHIWKTGGTSFFNICSENFGKGFHRDIMLIQNWFLSIDQLQWLMDYHHWVRCYSCHMLSGDLPYGYQGKDVVGIAFVRDPVDRFISSYNFQSHGNYRGGIAKQHDLDQFIDKALVQEDNPWWRNGQAFILGGNRSQAGLDLVSQRVKNGKILLLPTERFDECCILLEKLYPDDFADCSYTRLNSSKQRQPVTEPQRQAIAAHMDLDAKLMEMANEYLDAALGRIFPNAVHRQQYLDDFQNRCRKKKHQKRIVYFRKNLKETFKTILNRSIGRR